MSCISESLAFNHALPFNVLLEAVTDVRYSFYFVLMIIFISVDMIIAFLFSNKDGK